MKLGLKHSYEIFQLGPDATPDQVKQVYRTLVKKWHPDRFVHDPQLQRKAQEKFIEINEAYALLRNMFPDEPRQSDHRKASPRPPIPANPRRPSSGRVMHFHTPQESSRFGRIHATPALTIILVAVFALCTIIYARLTMPPQVHQPSAPIERDAKLIISWQKLEALKHLDQAKELYKDGKLEEAVFECERGLRLDSENIDLLNLRIEIRQVQLNETPNKATPREN